MVVYRAATQSITIDEADAFATYANRGNSLEILLYPLNGNHILYTLLSHLSTLLCGVSELTVRLPAVLGAFLFLASALFLCVRVIKGTFLALVVLIAMSLNPVVLDYLVAARGYSLAVGLLMVEVALLTSMIWQGARGTPASRVALASSCAGLSFCANFSFAFIDAAVIAAFLVWVWIEHAPAGRYHLILAAVLPGLAVAVAIAGWTLWHWPPGQLSWGAESYVEFLTTLRDYSFDRTNTVASNAIVLSIPSAVPTVLTVIATAAALVLLVAQRSRVAMFLGGALAIALTAHLAAFACFHLLLPMGRSAVFIPVLFALCLGEILSVTPSVRALRVVRMLGFVALVCSVVYFLACLRTSYFREWTWNADSRRAYAALRDLHHRCGANDFAVEWRYTGALNFYRRLDQQSTIENFERSDPFAVGRQAYVLYYPNEGTFVTDHHLTIVYRDMSFGTAIAVPINTCASSD